nr:hypothetical protein [uncultured Allomuricauda sp.]
METFYDLMLLNNWEFLLGVGNITLAIVVVGVTVYNNKRNRLVHLADKRKEWLVEFRSRVAELTALLTMSRFEDSILQNKKTSLDKEGDEKANYKFLEEIKSYNVVRTRMITLTNELMLLSFEDDNDAFLTTKMGDLLKVVSSFDKVQYEGEEIKTSELATKIMAASHLIVSAKWKKIKELDA